MLVISSSEYIKLIFNIIQDGLLGEKYRQLVDLNLASSYLIELTEKEFLSLIIQTPRNYSAFVLFNHPDEDCSVECQKAKTNLNTIRYSYQIQELTNPKMFFIQVVYENSHSADLFRRVSSTVACVLTYTYDLKSKYLIICRL